MNRIQCFFLTPTGEHVTYRMVTLESRVYDVETPTYRSSEGSLYHLGKGTSLHTQDRCLVEPAPAGAMWDADWALDFPGNLPGDDGLYLIVRTPGGDWNVDGTSSTPRWSRTGTVPRVTASPSIHFPGSYHGWLRDGYLEEC